jgi:hypothetical protein
MKDDEIVQPNTPKQERKRRFQLRWLGTWEYYYPRASDIQ